MRTVFETPTFQKISDKIWSEDERLEFITWIAANPLVGDVIPGSNGARKVRWKTSNTGKSGGVRIIYFNLVEKEIVYLLTMYTKSNKTNLSSAEIQKVI